MSGAEIGIAVIGAVAALITAYRDAGTIVENIKERRKAKGALPPSVALEESIQEGHQEIEKITAKGIQRFGSDFEQGDDIAHRALQSLTIEVQASFLHHLTLASKDDNVTNFEACIDSAIEARLRAVTILNELYLRQQKRSSLQSEPEVTVAQPSPRDSKDSKEFKELEGGKKRSSNLTRESEPLSTSPLRSRKPSWNPFKNLHRTSSSEQPKESTTSAPPIARSSSSNYHSPTLSPRPMMSSSPGSLNDFRRSQIMTPPISPASTHSSLDALTAAGFCKGAYYVQQGIYDKAVQVSMKNMEWSCHCRKCPFATPADRDERGRPRFDDRIYEANTLRFRSLLLFKSHLSSSQKKRRFYKCLICVFGGDSSSSFEGEHHLFEHMSRHQGGVLGGLELCGPICLEPNGVRAGSEGTFDLCFSDPSRFSLPPSAIELDVTEILEADSIEVTEEDEVFKNQWVDQVRK
ncbi:uncharacterized protein Z518_06983 [Rhinocladiella mackenziei CBS 650.93]|uniref:Rhinocladiella mackenziei CBS 650.93 unplaced genomic scaffold supercont1.5, whole genome shotgun sequence n=1 Tax=Rhinocladiella mackenziei CBS 650.93 TaxID=1442369 RepID=A0A0D2IJK2_9EURO|nr:uncharacterized protein Z518_06983 [Rhinocladiella mackenziei CBS 650.93]KIX03431.1 hypothetical protein Z518_06983 [Rhinocladiella mackenziei CBS 650.93]